MSGIVVRSDSSSSIQEIYKEMPPVNHMLAQSASGATLDIMPADSL